MIDKENVTDTIKLIILILSKYLSYQLTVALCLDGINLGAFDDDDDDEPPLPPALLPPLPPPLAICLL